MNLKEGDKVFALWGSWSGETGVVISVSTDKIVVSFGNCDGNNGHYHPNGVGYYGNKKTGKVLIRKLTKLERALK